MMIHWIYELRKLCLNGDFEDVKEFHEFYQDIIELNKTKSIVNAASISGNVELIEWLEKNGYRRDTRCGYNAGMNKDYKMIEYLYKTGKGGGVGDLTSAATGAASGGHLDLLKWLRDPQTLGGVCKWGAITLRHAAGRGDLEMVRYMRTPSKNGEICFWDCSAVTTAIKYDKVEMVKFLIENGCPYDKEWVYAYFENKSKELRLWFDNYY